MHSNTHLLSQPFSCFTNPIVFLKPICLGFSEALQSVFFLIDSGKSMTVKMCPSNVSSAVWLSRLVILYDYRNDLET